MARLVSRKRRSKPLRKQSFRKRSNRPLSRARSSLRLRKRRLASRSARRIGGHSFRAGDAIEVKDAPDVWRRAIVDKTADSMIRVRYTDGQQPDVEFVRDFSIMRPV